MCCQQKEFKDTVTAAPASVIVYALLTPEADYVWEITDPFGGVHHQEFTTDADGYGSIDPDGLPDGFINAGLDHFTIRVKEAADSCDYVPLPVMSKYDCIRVKVVGGTGEKAFVGCEQ